MRQGQTLKKKHTHLSHGNLLGIGRYKTMNYKNSPVLCGKDGKLHPEQRTPQPPPPQLPVLPPVPVELFRNFRTETMNGTPQNNQQATTQKRTSTSSKERVKRAV